METNPVSLRQCSFVNNVHLIIELESNTPPYYGIQSGKSRSLVNAVAMNINVNDTDPLNIKLINVFTYGHTWIIAERNAVLLVMSPFNVPIACVQINIDKTLLSIVNTARRQGLEKLGFEMGLQETQGSENRSFKRVKGGKDSPTSSTGYLLFQTIKWRFPLTVLFLPLSYINLSLRRSRN